MSQNMADPASAEEHCSPRDLEKVENSLRDRRNKENTAKLLNSNGPMPDEAQPADNGVEKPSKLKKIWGKLGLDLLTLMMMFKLVYTSHYHILSHPLPFAY